MTENALPLKRPSAYSRIIIKAFRCPQCQQIYQSTPVSPYYAYDWYGKEICGACMRKQMAHAVIPKGQGAQALQVDEPGTR